MRATLLLVGLVVLSCCAEPAPPIAEKTVAESTAPGRNDLPLGIEQSQRPGLALVENDPPESALPDKLRADGAEVERWYREHMPRWRAFFTNTPWHWSTGRPSKLGLQIWWMNPYEIDAFAPLVLVPVNPDGTDGDQDRWIRLRATRLRDEGAAYIGELVERYGLDLLDLVAICDVLDHDPSDIPVTPMSLPFSYDFDEEGTPRPGAPWTDEPDRHTYDPPAHRSSPPTGSAPAHAPRPVGPPQPPAPRFRPAKPPRYQNPWLGGGEDPPGWPKPTPYPQASPNGDPGGYSARDFLNGLEPNDVPEGMYPGSDDPARNPTEMEVFKCRGHVYRGYKDLCPDYNLLPNERWSKVLEQEFESLRGNPVDQLRRSPECRWICSAIVAAPQVPAGICGATTFALSLGSSAGYVLALDAACKGARGLSAIVDPLLFGASWVIEHFGFCEQSFCMPPSGQGKSP